MDEAEPLDVLVIVSDAGKQVLVLFIENPGVKPVHAWITGLKNNNNAKATHLCSMDLRNINRIVWNEVVNILKIKLCILNLEKVVSRSTKLCISKFLFNICGYTVIWEVIKMLIVQHTLTSHWNCTRFSG